MWFDSFESLQTVLIKGLLAYAFVVFALRVTGKRTLSKMNAFDLIVTVALGSTLASILLSADVTLAEGLVALTVLVVLQYVVTWLAVRFPAFHQMIKAEPTLLFHDQQYLDRPMRKERVTREELEAEVRAQGIATMTEVSSVVLETDGTLSVIRASNDSSEGTLGSVSH